MMKNQGLVFALWSILLFSLGRSEELIHGENSCRVLIDAHDRAEMQSRNFIGGQSNRWPGGVVPYLLDSAFSESQKKTIRDSIKHIEERTCVKFVEKTDDHTQYVHIFTGRSGCYANLGYSPHRSRFVVHLQSRGCVYVGIVVHELLHILGFGHEQTRPDRDEYVKIHWANLRDGTYSNFWRALGESEAASIPYCGRVGIDQYDNCYGGFRASTFGKDYDYGSVMHYGLNFFSKNGQNTMSLKKTTTETIPNRWGMTDLDSAKTRAAYNCAEPSSTTQASTTSPKEVSTTTTKEPTTTTTACQDTSASCKYFTRMCGRSPYVNKRCPKFCFNCDCKNILKRESCEMLKDNCDAFFIRNVCHDTCGSCN